MDHQHQIKIFSCRSSRYLAERIAASLKLDLGKSSVTVFSDGEFQPAFEESVRGATVFIVQSTFPPVDNIFELLLMIDAARRASAYKVIAVIPYFGWARQDRKDKPDPPLQLNNHHDCVLDEFHTCILLDSRHQVNLWIWHEKNGTRCNEPSLILAHMVSTEHQRTSPFPLSDPLSGSTTLVTSVMECEFRGNVSVHLHRCNSISYQRSVPQDYAPKSAHNRT